MWTRLPSDITGRWRTHTAGNEMERSSTVSLRWMRSVVLWVLTDIRRGRREESLWILLRRDVLLAGW